MKLVLVLLGKNLSYLNNQDNSFWKYPKADLRPIFLLCRRYNSLNYISFIWLFKWLYQLLNNQYLYLIKNLPSTALWKSKYMYLIFLSSFYYLICFSSSSIIKFSPLFPLHNKFTKNTRWKVSFNFCICFL